jgi:hypothetical protein
MAQGVRPRLRIGEKGNERDMSEAPAPDYVPEPEKTPDPAVEPDPGTTTVPGPLTEDPEDFPEADRPH